MGVKSPLPEYSSSQWKHNFGGMNVKVKPHNF